MLKFASNKSNAKRALSKIGVAALQAAEMLLVEGTDGKWGFDVDAAERIQDDADNVKVEKEAPVAVTVTVVRDGKKVSENGVKVAEQAAPVKEVPAHPQDGSCCPNCGIKEDQTYNHPEKEVALYCNHCEHEYFLNGKPFTSRAGQGAGRTRENVSKGYAIEKGREKQNGVVRRSAGTLCGAVWDALDVIQARDGAVTAKELPALADANGWNKNNVACEYYAWRKFHGISGRVSK
jgi:hypothetical protein